MTLDGMIADTALAHILDASYNRVILHTGVYRCVSQSGSTDIHSYDMNSVNFNDADIAWLPRDRMPEVILVRKSYSNRQRHRRNWKLQQLPKVMEEDAARINQQSAEYVT